MFDYRRQLPPKVQTTDTYLCPEVTRIRAIAPPHVPINAGISARNVQAKLFTEYAG
jgi:hypothetical protein